MLRCAAEQGEVAAPVEPMVALAALFGPLLLRSAIGATIAAAARETARVVARGFLAPPLDD